MKLNDKTKKILAEIPKGMPPMEEDILPVVNAINALPGLTTLESCGGHGNQYPYVSFSVEKNAEAVASLCFVVHGLKPFFWRLVATPYGSIGDISIRFHLMSPIAIKEMHPDQPCCAIRAVNPLSVKEAKKDLNAIAHEITRYSKESRLV